MAGATLAAISRLSAAEGCPKQPVRGWPRVWFMTTALMPELTRVAVICKGSNNMAGEAQVLVKIVRLGRGGWWAVQGLTDRQ